MTKSDREVVGAVILALALSFWPIIGLIVLGWYLGWPAITALFPILAL